jgi:hypothetical protein
MKGDILMKTLVRHTLGRASLCLGAVLVSLASPSLADTTVFESGRPIHIFPTRSAAQSPTLSPPPVGPPMSCGQSPGGIEYNGGPVIQKALQKSIWWGQSGFDPDVQSHVSKFFGRFGGSGEYDTITQYGDSTGLIQNTKLSKSHKTDPSAPLATVTDAGAQAEIIANLITGKLGKPNDHTIYYLFLPDGVTSTLGSLTSCIDYCAYHSYFWFNGMALKYAVVPYPSCGVCQGSYQDGLSLAAASMTIFTAHETREAVTDPMLDAWWDTSTGQEADDKCAWQLFIDNDGFQYQKEWSFAANACVMKGICGP